MCLCGKKLKQPSNLPIVAWRHREQLDFFLLLSVFTLVWFRLSYINYNVQMFVFPLSAAHLLPTYGSAAGDG